MGEDCLSVFPVMFIEITLAEMISWRIHDRVVLMALCYASGHQLFQSAFNPQEMYYTLMVVPLKQWPLILSQWLPFIVKRNHLKVSATLPLHPSTF